MKLDAGRFKRRDAAPHGRAMMIRWYTDHALPWLTASVARYAERAHAKPGAVTGTLAVPAGGHRVQRRRGVQDLGFRWGSCGKGGRLSQTWAFVPRSAE